MVKKNQKTKPVNNKRKVNPGRPPIEEQTIWTEEMSQYCWRRRKGMLPEEAAEALGIETEKAFRYEKNPMVQNRIEYLFGNKKEGWNILADELYEISLQTAIKLIKEGKVPWKELTWCIERLERRFGIYEEVEVQKGKRVAIKKEEDTEEEKGIFDE